MKPNWIAVALSGLLAAWPGVGPSIAQPTLGIPEPGLLLFGSVTNAAGGFPLPLIAVTWQISSGPDLVTVPATVVVVNGQFFHVAPVPFETRSAGPTNFGQTPNVLALTAIPSTYTRSAWVGTNRCSFLNPSQADFVFSKADRGKSERVDLAVSISTTDLDADGDGMPDRAELIAGTDPNDPKSVLKLSPIVRSNPAGGLVIEWHAMMGKSYSVWSTTNLSLPLTLRESNLTLPNSSQVFYWDPTATGPGPFFYRIKVNQ